MQPHVTVCFVQPHSAAFESIDSRRQIDSFKNDLDLGPVSTYKRSRNFIVANRRVLALLTLIPY